MRTDSSIADADGSVAKGWLRDGAMTHSDEQSLERELAEAKSEMAALRVENARLRGLLGLDDRATAAPRTAWKPTLFTPAE